MREGDVYITNDPWMGHRPPQRLRGHDARLPSRQARALFFARATSPISEASASTDATDVYMEALGIPFLKLFDRGVRNETLIAIVKDNTRLPVECEGDLYSLANCNEIGARRLVEMLEEFGLADIEGW